MGEGNYGVVHEGFFKSGLSIDLFVPHFPVDGVSEAYSLAVVVGLSHDSCMAPVVELPGGEGAPFLSHISSFLPCLFVSPEDGPELHVVLKRVKSRVEEASMMQDVELFMNHRTERTTPNWCAKFLGTMEVPSNRANSRLQQVWEDSWCRVNVSTMPVFLDDAVLLH